MFLPIVVLSILFFSLSSQESKECKEATGHDKCSYLADDQLCGAPHRFKASSRIIGGQETAMNEFPWMACLQRDQDVRDHSCFCNGALISRLHVLTATHCVMRRNLGPFAVTLGEHHLRTDPDCDGDNNCANPIQRIPTRRVIVNNRVRNPRELNDIALITLHRAVEINRYVMPICLPFRGFDNTDNAPMKAAGWGKVDFEGEHERNNPLHYYDVDPVPMEECKRLRNSGDYAVDDDRKVCTNTRDKTTGEIKTMGSGDSGGPLMSYRREGENLIYYVIGVASYSDPNIPNMRPAVYTRVSRFIPWVLDNL